LFGLWHVLASLGGGTANAAMRIGASRRIPVAAVTEYVERLRREAAA
jgi:hypothetical protein